jgi:hypothetical protein
LVSYSLSFRILAKLEWRLAAIVLMIGAAISAIPKPAVEIVLMIAIAWMGFLLFTRRESTGQAPPPRVN